MDAASAPPERPATPRRSDTVDPRRSRERALKILFQADLRDVDPQQVLDPLDEDASARAMLDDADGRTDAPAIDGFTRTLVLGVAADRVAIDDMIGRFARRWAISRMPVVDRTVLRLAVYELLHEPTPPAVVIDEAVELAKALSTGDSGRYVNGVLESIRRNLAADREDRPGA